MLFMINTIFEKSSGKCRVEIERREIQSRFISSTCVLLCFFSIAALAEGHFVPSAILFLVLCFSAWIFFEKRNKSALVAYEYVITLDALMRDQHVN